VVSQELKFLQLAFTYHMVEQIIGSDEDLDPHELRYLDQVFPPALMREHGLLDAHGHHTPAFDEARNLALLELPSRLTRGEKLALIEVLVGAAAADGVLAAEEVDALHGAARMLGLDDQAWAEHLQQLIASGRVQRDDAGV
jgi:uncharacterized tellurite resistance protein B-like protein